MPSAQDANCKGRVAASSDGANSRRQTDELMGEAGKHGRVLGPHLHGEINVSVEVKRRCEAARAGWARGGKIWTSSAPPKLKRALFIGLVQNTILSAMEAFVLEARHINLMDTVLCKLLRALGRGAIHMKPGDHIYTMTNAEVMKQ